MKTLYIHAGYFKTGTTAIQHFFHHHGSLVESYGYYYLKSGRPKNNKTTHSLYPLKRLHEEGINVPPWFRVSGNINLSSQMVLEDLAKEAKESPFKNIVVSSEEFVRFYEFKDPREEISLFLSRFSGFNVKVVFFLREPLDYTESWYNQMIKTKSPARRFSDFWLELKKSQTHYFSMISAWADQVGRENIILKPYGHSGAQHLLDFFNAIDLTVPLHEIERKLPRKDVNKRLTNESMELSRIKNHVVKNTGFREFVAGYDTPDFSADKNKKLIKKSEVINNELRNLYSHFEFKAALNWMVCYENVIDIENKVNSILSCSEDDRLYKSMAYLSMQLEQGASNNKYVRKKLMGMLKEKVKRFLK